MEIPHSDWCEHTTRANVREACIAAALNITELALALAVTQHERAIGHAATFTRL